MAGVNVATNRYATSSIIVGTSIADGCMFTSIQSALDYANTNSLTQIFIKPGTYTENIAPYNGQCISAYGGGQLGPVKIVGKMTLDGVLSATFENLYFKTNGDYLLQFTGTATANQSNFYHCTFSYATNAILLNNSSASPFFNFCVFAQTAASTAAFVGTSCGQPTLQYCYFPNNSGGGDGNSTVASGNIILRYCQLKGQTWTTSSSGYFEFTACTRVTSGNSTVLTTAGTGTTTINDCFFQSGSSAAISIGSGTTVNAKGLTIDSTNSNPITGAGTFNSSPVIFSNTGYGINVTTKTLRNIDAGGISFDYGSNVLSNYSTGTYSPVVNGSVSNPTVTYTAQNGNYTRIGNMLYVDYNVACSSFSGGSGDIRITLPGGFTARSATSTVGAVQINKITLGARSYITSYINGGWTYLVLTGFVSATNGYIYQISDFSTTSFQIYGNVVIPI